MPPSQRAHQIGGTLHCNITGNTQHDAGADLHCQNPGHGGLCRLIRRVANRQRHKKWLRRKRAG